MKVPDIDEAQRSEIEFALLARRADLEKLVVDSTKKHARNLTAEKLLKLYQDDEDIDRARGTRRTLPGLLSIFAGEPELSAEAIADRDAGAKRTTDGEQDLWGGGSEVGGGHPPGETGHLDRYGNVHATREAADEANGKPDPRLDRGGVGAEPASEPEEVVGTIRRIPEKSSATDEVPADYEIVDDGTPAAGGETPGDAYANEKEPWNEGPGAGSWSVHAAEATPRGTEPVQSHGDPRSTSAPPSGSPDL